MKYSTGEAAKLAGISYRQLDYWVRTDLVQPTVPARGSGTQRRFSDDDVSLLLILASLRQSGYELSALRRYAQGQTQLAVA